jgi:hypothetical protein
MINDAVLFAWPIDSLALDTGCSWPPPRRGSSGRPSSSSARGGGGDSITVQVAEGTAPAEPGALLYIQGRGTFRQVRCERWPGGRVLLTLAAWPRR